MTINAQLQSTAVPGAPSRLKEWTLRAVLMTCSLLFALVAAELMARVFFPLYDGRNNVTLDGKPITEWFTPGTVYRQISNEYDAKTTITDKGHRVPGASGSPEVIFLGDSFTYGYGLNDDETFASIYCAERERSCANLGAPGTGTSRQVQRLRRFLDEWNWRPKEVRLVFFGMSSSFSAGNDFVDNYNYGRWLRGQRAGQTGQVAVRSDDPSPGMGAQLIGSQKFLLEHSTLVRRAKYHWGPVMKSLLLADPGDRMAEALVYTEAGLKELDELSRSAGFDYSIYLVVPVHDVMRGTHTETLAALNRVAPKPAIPTAQLFVDSPQKYLLRVRRTLESCRQPSNRRADDLPRDQPCQILSADPGVFDGARCG